MAQTEQFDTRTDHRPNPVGSVVERMRSFRANWPATDGLAVFNRVYLAVTEEIGRRIDGLEERLGVKLLVRTTRKITQFERLMQQVHDPRRRHSAG